MRWLHNQPMGVAILDLRWATVHAFESYFLFSSATSQEQHEHVLYKKQLNCVNHTKNKSQAAIYEENSSMWKMK